MDLESHPFSGFRVIRLCCNELFHFAENDKNTASGNKKSCHPEMRNISWIFVFQDFILKKKKYSNFGIRRFPVKPGMTYSLAGAGVTPASTRYLFVVIMPGIKISLMIF
jgi:hypothetical protein